MSTSSLGRADGWSFSRRLWLEGGMVVGTPPLLLVCTQKCALGRRAGEQRSANHCPTSCDFTAVSKTPTRGL
ncbi:unnamed protein product [Gadus morhua 'NCC']